MKPSPESNFRSFSSPLQDLSCPCAVSPQCYPQPRQPLICTLALKIFPCWTFYINGATQYIQPSDLAPFTQHSVCKVYPCCSLCQHFALSYHLIVLHCADLHILFISSPTRGHWGRFQFLATRYNAHTKTSVFISLEYIPRSRITGSYNIHI